MTDKTREAVGRLTKINDQISDHLENGPEGSFRHCLEWLEEKVAEENQHIWKVIELLKGVNGEEYVDVKVGYGLDEDSISYADVEGNWDADLLREHGVDGESNVESLEWSFRIPKSKVRSFYFMLQFLAGLDMPLQHNIDMGMFVNGVRYNGGDQEV